jgi:hypothetical protein
VTYPGPNEPHQPGHSQPGDPYATSWRPAPQPQYGPPAAPVPPPVTGTGYPPPYPPGPAYQQAPLAPVAKKRTSTKTAIGIIAAVLVLCCGGGAIAAAIHGNKGSTGNAGATNARTGAATTQGAQAAAATTAAAPPPKAAGLNTPVRDGKFEFTVTSVKYGIAQVGDSFLNEKAQGQFAEVAVTVRNIGTEPRTFTGANQTAYGDGNVRYQDDGAAEIYANTDDQTFLNNINPGNSVQGILIFDIPKGAKLTKIELHDSMLSGGVTVQLS